MAQELRSRGFRNIEDALFIRDRLLQIAVEQGRWNIAVFESYRIIELVIKGMICLMGSQPERTHEIDKLVDQLLKASSSPSGNAHHLPLTLAVLTTDQDHYGVDFIDGAAILYWYNAGSYTRLAAAYDLSNLDLNELIDVHLHRKGTRIDVFIGQTCIMSADNPDLTDPLKSESTFRIMPDGVRAEKIKKAGSALREKREASFYSETAYDQEQALNAIGVADNCIQMLRELVLGMQPEKEA